jgi:hypothetical protein
MHALRSPFFVAGTVAGVAAALGVAVGCQKKISQQQCDALLDRYAQLVVVERHPDASDQMIRAEQDRERGEARGDDNFKNCTSELRPTEFDCAMAASTSDALIKCLE